MKNPWVKLPFNGKLVLSDDEPFIIKANSYLSDDFKYHLDLFPEPYIGNIESSVVALNLNPGVDLRDVTFHCQPLLKEIMMDNLLHKCKEFYYLKDEFFESPGSEWWRKRLNGLIESTSHKKVLERFLVIEKTGYHSIKFKDKYIPSNDYCIYLVREAIKRSAKIIIMRGKSYWFHSIPELVSYCTTGNVFSIKNPLQPYFSEKNLDGFDVIVKSI